MATKHQTPQLLQMEGMQVSDHERNVSSHSRAKHAMLNQCHSAVCDFFNVAALSVTSLEMPMNGLPKVNQVETDLVIELNQCQVESHSQSEFVLTNMNCDLCSLTKTSLQLCHHTLQDKVTIPKLKCTSQVVILEIVSLIIK